MVVKNDLFDYSNRYIYQDENAFKFSVDSILLAEYVTNIKPNDLIVDLCAGNMAAGLIISKYCQNKIVGFEIQKNIYNLGQKSIIENNLTNNLSIINDDVLNISKYFSSDSIDIIICNPPYFKVTDNKMTNINENKKIARHEISLNLEDIFKIAKVYLKNNGSLYLVHRTQRIDEIINYGQKYNVKVKNIQLVSTKKGKNSAIVLIKCVKNSKNGVIIAPEICIDGLKTYQNIFRR